MTRKETSAELVGPDGKGEETWRDLARRIKRETDPAKVIEMARLLIVRLDEEGLKSRSAM
jgi:hypothetical protein